MRAQVGEALPQRALDVGDGVVALDGVAVERPQGGFRVVAERLAQEAGRLRRAQVQDALTQDAQHLRVLVRQSGPKSRITRLDQAEQRLVESDDGYGLDSRVAGRTRVLPLAADQERR